MMNHRRKSIRAIAIVLALAAFASADLVAEGRRRGRGSPDAIGKDDRTPLTRAIQEGKGLGEIRAMLDAGADPNAIDGTGYPPLSISLFRGNAAIVGLLLSAGADPNLVYHDGERILNEYLRLAPDDAETLGALLDGGADPDERGRYGHTALTTAIRHDLSAAMVLRLLEAGADPALACEDGSNAWHFLARRIRYSDTDADLDGIFALMARNGAEGALLPDGRGESALLIACENGGGRLAPRFIDAGKALGERGTAWIRLAYPPCMRALIPAIGSTRSGDAAGLHAIFGAFLDCGIDASTPLGDDGSDALLLTAAYPSLHECSSLLIDRGAQAVKTASAGSSALMAAVEADNVALVRRLAETGVDPNARDAKGASPLEAARSVECARALIGMGADPGDRGADGRSLLEIACGNDSAPDLVSFHLDSGLAPNEGEARARILLTALAAGAAAKTLILLDRGFDHGVRFPDGKNALHGYLSIHKERLEDRDADTETDLALVNRLLDLGVSPEEADDAGETAYSCLESTNEYGAIFRKALYDRLSGPTRAAIDARNEARAAKLAREETRDRISRASLAAGLPLAYLGACIGFREGLFADEKPGNPFAAVNGIVSLGAAGFIAGGVAGLALTIPLTIGGSGLGGAWAGIRAAVLILVAGGIGAFGGALIMIDPGVRAAFTENGLLYYLIPALASATGIGIGIHALNGR